MKSLTLSLSLLLFVAARTVRADGPIPGVSKMEVSAPAVPSIGGDVRGQPNLFDFEYVTARLTIRSPDKTLTGVTFAPFLTSDYNPWISEIRFGTFVESSGAFGLGTAWGYSQARRDLSTEPLPTLGSLQKCDLQKIQQEQAKRRGVLAAAVHVACAQLRDYVPHCSLGVPGECEIISDADAACKGKTGPVNLAPLANQLISKLAILTPPVASDIYAPVDLDSRLADLIQTSRLLRVARDEYEMRSDEVIKALDDKLIKDKRAERLERAYRHSVGFNLLGAVGWFPIVEAPDIAPMMSTDPPRNVFENHVRNVDVSAAARVYGSRNQLVQLRGGYRWERVDPVVGTELTSEYYVGLDLAAMKLLSQGPDESGFQPGIGGGVTLLLYRCVEERGCKTELELGDQYPKAAALEHRTQLTAFVEWRLRKEFQVRLSVDVFVDKGKDQIPGTNPSETSPRLTHMVPSLSVGSSFWGL